jgi:hypothetical protein
MPGMDSIEAFFPPLTADQYRARANFIRATAADKTDTVRQQLLGIAEEYDCRSATDRSYSP